MNEGFITVFEFQFLYFCITDYDVFFISPEGWLFYLLRAYYFFHSVKVNLFRFYRQYISGTSQNMHNAVRLASAMLAIIKYLVTLRASYTFKIIHINVPCLKCLKTAIYLSEFLHFFVNNSRIPWPLFTDQCAYARGNHSIRKVLRMLVV